MAGRACTWIALRSFAGIGLEPVDDLLEILRREISSPDDQEGLNSELGDRRKIIEHVERQRKNRAVDAMRAQCTDAHAVAVGRGTRDAADTQRPRSTTDVFNDHWLTERHSQALTDDPRQRVRRAAGRE